MGQLWWVQRRGTALLTLPMPSRLLLTCHVDFWDPCGEDVFAPSPAHFECLTWHWSGHSFFILKHFGKLWWLPPHVFTFFMRVAFEIKLTIFHDGKLTVLKVAVTLVAVRRTRRIVLQLGKQVQRLCPPLLHPSVLLFSAVVKIPGAPSSRWGLESLPPSWIIGLLFGWGSFVCAGTWSREIHSKSCVKCF